MRKTSSLFILTALLSNTAMAVTADQASAYNKLEEVRRQAGMPVLTVNTQLENAAQGHANYLLSNSITGHYQTIGTPGFTGTTPTNRAIAANYSNQLISENVSSGNLTAINSVSTLMTAIYHRFGFLNFKSDEAGIGVTGAQSASGRYVYDLGSQLMSEACEQPEASSGTYYTNVCNPDIKLAEAFYNSANNRAQARNPAVILWPAPGAINATPAFFEESPDPLPDFSVSGNPISVQFNKFYFSNIEVSEFRLFDQNGSEITNTRLIDSTNDVNSRFDTYQYALFPLDRLKWNTPYSVRLVYIADGETFTKEWGFTTAKPEGLDSRTVNQNGQQFIMGNGSEIAIYIPPESTTDTIGSVSYSYSSGSNVDLRFIDQNTLYIRYNGSVGNKVSVTTSSGKQFSIQLDSSTALAANPKGYPVGSCIENGQNNTFTSNDNILRIPHVLVDGKSAYAVELTLISDQPELTFLLTSASGVSEDVSCRSASFSGKTGELFTPIIDAPGIGTFRAELQVDDSQGDLRFILKKLTPAS